MPRRLSCLFALLLVADAILVTGRGPRPINLSGKDVLEMVRIERLQPATLA
jgi:hypothetical protein